MEAQTMEMEVEQVQELNPAADKKEGHLKSESAKRKSAEEVRREVMCNSLVFGKITSTLPSNTLLKLRTTCINWNQNFIPEVKKKHRLIKLSVLPSSNPRHSRQKDRYMEIMRSSHEMLFTRFKFEQLDGDEADADTVVGRPIFHFISKFGNSISGLDLAWSSPKVLTIAELWKIVFEMTPNLSHLRLENLQRGRNEQEPQSIKISGSEAVTKIPKLTELTTWSESCGEDGMNTPSFIALMTAILQSAPNLESFNLDAGIGTEYIPSTITTFQNLTAIEKLKTLSVGGLEVAPLRTLLQMSQRKENTLRVEQFSGTLHVPTNDNYAPSEEFTEMIQLLRDFLLSQASTLKSLRLEFIDAGGVDKEYWPVGMNVNLPRFTIHRLEQLETFRLDTVLLIIIKVQYDAPDKDFQSAFPRLSRFTFYGDLDKDFMELSHPRITSLEINEVGAIELPESIGRLPCMFPAVTRLELGRKNRYFWSGVNVSAFQISSLWTLWPALTHLHARVSFPEDTTPDEWLSGVARTDFQDLQRDLDALPKPLNRDWDSLGGLLCRYKTGPALANLRHLKELKLELMPTKINSNSEAEADAVGVTDLGGYFGLAVASEHLQHLEIRGSPKNSVSDECLAFIRTDLPLYAVIEL